MPETEIIFVLDKSASMESLRFETIKGINQFVEIQRELPGSAVITLVQFSDPDKFEVSFEGAALNDVPFLDMEFYRPGGMTALYDAIGITIDQTLRRFRHTLPSETPDKVLFAIMTDGDENSSKKYNADDIRAKIVHCQDVLKWEFEFFSSDQSIWNTAEVLGISRDKVRSYSADQLGTQSAYAMLSDSATSTRSKK